MLDAPHARASRWFRRWLGTYLVFLAGSALSAPRSALTAQSLVAGGILIGSLITLALCVAWRLGRGKCVGLATALVGFFAMGCPIPIAYVAMNGINPGQEWIVIPLGSLFVVVTIYTFVLLLTLLSRTRDTAAE